MANYTVVNLAEVENQVARHGIDPEDLQLRMGRVPLEMEHAGISLVKLGPGYRNPAAHTHNRQEETYICVAGSARMNVDGEIVEMTPYTAVPNNVPLDERNPAGPAMTPADRYWQEKSLALNWSEIDGPDPYWLNRINWHSLFKGTRPTIL